MASEITTSQNGHWFNLNCHAKKKAFFFSKTEKFGKFVQIYKSSQSMQVNSFIQHQEKLCKLGNSLLARLLQIDTSECCQIQFSTFGVKAHFLLGLLAAAVTHEATVVLRCAQLLWEAISQCTALSRACWSAKWQCLCKFMWENPGAYVREPRGEQLRMSGGRIAKLRSIFSKNSQPGLPVKQCCCSSHGSN